mgnify:CR=1 FL=1
MKKGIEELMLESKKVYKRIYEERAIGPTQSTFKSEDIEFLDFILFVENQLELILEENEN